MLKFCTATPVILTLCSPGAAPSRLSRPRAVSGESLNLPLQRPRTATTCRAPQRGPGFAAASVRRGRPTSSCTLFQTQGRCPLPPAQLLVGTESNRQHSAGCFVDYYILTASVGARPPLEPSAARPHTAAPLIPLLDSHFLTISVRSLVPAQRPPRPSFSGGRASFWLASAVPVAPAARPSPPRRLRALEIECHRLPGWAAGAALGPCVGGLRGW